MRNAFKADGQMCQLGHWSRTEAHGRHVLLFADDAAGVLGNGVVEVNLTFVGSVEPNWFFVNEVFLKRKLKIQLGSEYQTSLVFE